MTQFQYDARIIEDYPRLVGGVIIGKNMTNQPTPAALRDIYLDEQAAVKTLIGDRPLSDLPPLKAWRRAFSAFGVSPTKYRSAAEALLRRLTKKGDIPCISALVDIGNLVSIRYALPVAIFDTRQITTPITVHYSDGSERYTELASRQTMRPDPGEVVFSDTTKMVLARRWCWRQSAASAANNATTDALITIEAHHHNGPAAIENALADLLALLNQHAGGQYESAVLTSEKPAI